MLRKGFTLIELLVVIAIIATITSIGIFALNNSRQSSRDAKRKTDLEQIRSALELYKADCNNYPAAVPAAGNPLQANPAAANCAGNTVTYIAKWPKDPTTGHSYAYNPSGAPVTSYTFCASLESITSAVPPGCAASCGTACNYAVTSP